MNIWFDVTQLGLGYKRPGFHQAGVYRVVTSLLPYLLANGDIDWTFFSAKPSAAVVSEKALTDWNQGTSLPFWLPEALRRHPYLREVETLRHALESVRPSDGTTKQEALNWRWQRFLLKQFFPQASSFYQQAFPAEAAGADLIHYMNANDLNRQYAMPSGVPRVVTVYDLIPLCCEAVKKADPTLAHKQQATLSRLTAEDWVLCISESTKRDLVKHFPQVNPERIRYLPNAASEYFQPCDDPTSLTAIKQRYGLRPEDNYLLSLGTLAVHKNTRLLVEQMLQYLERTNKADLHLLLVGAARDDDKSINTLLRQYPKAAQHIHWTGFIPDEALPALYSGALGFCFLSQYEGFGLPVLEAMQCGTPVLSSNRASLPEVVGSAAILVDPADKTAIQKGLAQLVEDAELRKKLKAAGLERAKLFSWRKTASGLIKTYEEIMKTQ